MDPKWARERIESVLDAIEGERKAARENSRGGLVRPLGLGAALILAAGVGGCGGSGVLYGLPPLDGAAADTAVVDSRAGSDADASVDSVDDAASGEGDAKSGADTGTPD